MIKNYGRIFEERTNWKGEVELVEVNDKLYKELSEAEDNRKVEISKPSIFRRKKWWMPKI